MSLLLRSLRSGSLFRALQKPGFVACFSTVKPNPKQETSLIPKLARKPEALLLKNWWSETPFDKTKPLTLPVYSFREGDYSGKNIDLDHEIFNQPLRRDIVHRVYEWRKVLFKRTTHIARTKGTTAGSGVKPFKQKGTGRARQGNKRAPGRWKGGKAHGPKPRDLAYPLNKKVRLMALKVMLSAKLAEGKLRIVDSESIEKPKTRILSKILERTFGDRTRVLLVPGYSQDKNLLIASQNLQQIEITSPNRLNVLKLLKCDKLVLTVNGLSQLTQDLKDRSTLLYRNRKIKRTLVKSEKERNEAAGVVEEKPEAKFDPSKPLKLRFKVLENYLKEYERKREEEGKK